MADGVRLRRLCRLARHMREPGCGHLGPDAGAHQHEEGQGGQVFQLGEPVGHAEIAVHQPIGILVELPYRQIHQWEGEVVEHVAGGHPVVELDGVEQNRVPVDQHDVAQMRIAVAAPDPPRAPALAQERPDP